MSRLFVTGGTGFIGTRVVERLTAAGHDVRALSRDADRVSDPPAGVSIVEGDITDRSSLREPMTGVDGVFHMAAWYDVGPGRRLADRAEQINVEGTRNVLELMADLEIPRGVYVSSLAVNADTHGRAVDETYRHDGAFPSVYDRTKWQAHYEVAAPLVAEGLPLITVSPGVVYGPGDTSPVRERLWVPYIDGDLPVVPRKTGYSFGHVDDTADGIVTAWDAGTPGEEYNINGHNRTLLSVLELAEEITGIAPPRAVPPGVFGVLSRLVGLVEPVIQPPEGYEAESFRALAGTTYYGDNTKATRELGLDHRPLEEGFREYLEWELDQQGRQSA